MVVKCWWNWHLVVQDVAWTSPLMPDLKRTKYQIHFWGFDFGFHQYFMSSCVCLPRFKSTKRHLWLSMSFCIFGIFPCKKFSKTCYWNLSLMSLFCFSKFPKAILSLAPLAFGCDFLHFSVFLTNQKANWECHVTRECSDLYKHISLRWGGLKWAKKV